MRSEEPDAHKSRHLVVAFAAIRRDLPGPYHALEAALSAQPVAVQLEFYQLVDNFTRVIAKSRRDARRGFWRR